MKKITIFIALLMVLIGSGMAQATTITVCNSGCDATNLSEANGFALDGDIISLQGDLLLENMNLINKVVTVEGNGHTVNISLSTSSQRAIELHGMPAVFNNLTLKLQNRYNTVFLLNGTDFGGRTWNNLRIEATDTVPGTLAGLVIPNHVTGIAIWGSSNLTINNYTSHDILVPVNILDSNYGTLIKSTNLTINGDAVMEKNGVSGLTDSMMMGMNVEDVSFNSFDISGYNIGIAAGAYNGGSCEGGTTDCFPKNITYKGTLRSNKYGLRMNTINPVILDSVFDNDIDATIIGTDYQISNSSFKTLVSLPNATNFNVSNWVINKVTVEGTEYDVVGGYDVVATIPSAAPYNLTLSYNKSRVTELNLDTASLRVLHINAPNETLTPIATDTARGTLTVQTSSFSPFVIYGVRLSTPSTTSSSGGGGGGSGGGSGGGAASSPEAFNNIARMGKVELFWNAGKQAVHVYKDLDISSVAIVPNKSAGYIEVRVEELKQKSNLTKTEPSVTGGKLYKYYNIWLGTMGMASIQNAEIKFKTPLIDGKATKAIMMRYDDKTQAWEPLDTVLDSSDAQFAYYSAKTAKFSSVVIIYGLPMGGGAPITLDTVAETAVNPPVSTPPPTPENTPAAQSPGFESVAVLITIAGATIVCRKIRL